MSCQIASIVSRAGRKQAIHFGAPGRPLFGFYHPPAEGRWKGAGVVLCAPFGTDHTRSDRTYRHLAERLAAAGFACLRFDPFGTGDSGGDEHAPRLVRAWLDDVSVAIEELRARSGARAIALAGLRLGATLAAFHAAERGDVDAVVLWSPCVSGAGFVREVVKLHKLYARIEPQIAATPPPPGDGEEALGAYLPRAVIDDLSAIDLMQLARRPAPRALVVDGGMVQGLPAFVDKLRALGVETELQPHPGHKFLLTISHRAELPGTVLDAITGWLDAAFPGAGPPVAREPLPSSAAAPAGERLVVFGAERPLFGILTPGDPAAAAARTGASRPPILLTNAGCVNRSGAHRASVKMARRWASMGVDVLRVDLSGIGDSPVAPGAPENVTYPPGGRDDLDQAMRALGQDRVVLAGLCSGGDYAYQLGGVDQRVVGAWMLNPRTFLVLDLAAVESGDGAPPKGDVGEVPRHLRQMADAGVDALLVVSVGDPGVTYADTHASDAMRALAGVERFQRVDIEGADHTFTPVTTQDRVMDVLTRHLAAKY